MVPYQCVELLLVIAMIAWAVAGVAFIAAALGCLLWHVAPALQTTCVWLISWGKQRWLAR